MEDIYSYKDIFDYEIVGQLQGTLWKSSSFLLDLKPTRYINLEKSAYSIIFNVDSTITSLRLSARSRDCPVITLAYSHRQSDINLFLQQALIP